MNDMTIHNAELENFVDDIGVRSFNKTQKFELYYLKQLQL